MEISEQSVIIRNKNIVATDFDGETVMIAPDFKKYFGMESVGTQIWAELNEETKVADLCRHLTSEYAVPYNTCLEDVRCFLQDLLINHMITVVAK